jgi:hypothetical protein
MTHRSLIQRAGAALLLASLPAVLFYCGKGHTLLLDTNAVTIDGKEYASADTVNVAVDGHGPESMGRAERAQVTVGGPRHTIAIEVATDDRKVVRRISIPTFMDTALVSVPAILGGAPRERWVTQFVAPPPEEVPAEQIRLSDAPASPEGATGAPAAPGQPAPATPPAPKP